VGKNQIQISQERDSGNRILKRKVIESGGPKSFLFKTFPKIEKRYGWKFRPKKTFSQQGDNFHSWSLGDCR